MGTKLTKDIVNKRLHDLGILNTLTGEYLGARTKTKFRCTKGHEWNSRPDHIMNGSGCPMCYSNAPLSEEIINERLLSRGIKLIDEYNNCYTKLRFRCDSNHEWKSTSDNVLRGNGCPNCTKYGFNPLNPAFGYVLKFDLFIKYGITQSLQKRILQHRKINGDFEIIITKLFDTGREALDWENYVKRTFGGKYVDKTDCPDGYTETLSVNLSETIRGTLLNG